MSIYKKVRNLTNNRWIKLLIYVLTEVVVLPSLQVISKSPRNLIPSEPMSIPSMAWKLSILYEMFSLVWPSILYTRDQIFLPNTGGSRLMRISFVRISLLRVFKTFHKYLTNANFGLFVSLVPFFGQNISLMRIFGLFISLLRFALC